MKAKKLISLNPYYTGSYSIRCNAQDVYNIALGLNPYYTGSYSISLFIILIQMYSLVS